MTDELFNELALRVFAFQYDQNRTYGRYSAGRGATPDTVSRWEEVPAVPATAFKHVDLIAGDPSSAEAVFQTSGTSRGMRDRGRHLVRSLALYRASLLPPFRRHLLPDGARLPFLSLVLSPEAAPDSSLSYMVGAAAAELSTGARWLAEEPGGIDVAAFVREVAGLRERNSPALLVGTAFSFVHLVDALGPDTTPQLPEGSRIMETGGFKGRSRHVERDDLYAALSELVGVPERRIVNEYGMTELLSQLYEPVLEDGEGSRGRHVPAPWLRVRALEPATLAPLPPGEVGLLAFFDLANLGSVSHVLTEDLGSVAPDGVRLAGRLEGAEPRGCSLALDELVSVAEEVG